MVSKLVEIGYDGEGEGRTSFSTFNRGGGGVVTPYFNRCEGGLS